MELQDAICVPEKAADVVLIVVISSARQPESRTEEQVPSSWRPLSQDRANVGTMKMQPVMGMLGSEKFWNGLEGVRMYAWRDIRKRRDIRERKNTREKRDIRKKRNILGRDIRGKKDIRKGTDI